MGGVYRRPDGPALSYALMAGSAFLIALAALAVPGLVRRDRVVAFLAAAAVLLLAGLVTLALGRISRRGAHVLAVAAIVCGGTLVASIADPVGRGISATWFVLIPMFMSTSLSRREVAAYGVVSTACAVLLVATLPSENGLMTAIRLAVIAGSVALPITYFLVLRRDLDHALAAATELSRRDSLTGLLNRRGLTERFAELAGLGVRTRAVLAVLVCDIDHFKRINDTLGHPEGDLVLRQVAAITTSCFRPGDLVARLGGEELAVGVLVRNGLEAGDLAERWRTAVAADCTRWHLTVSIGVATSPAVPEPTLDDLVARADAELYRAKAAGRNRVSPAPA